MIPASIVDMLSCLNVFKQAVVAIDLQGNALYVNDSFSEWFGHTVDTLKQPGAEALFESSSVLSEIVETVGEGESFCGEVFVRSRVGEQFEVCVTAASLRAGSQQPVGALLVLESKEEQGVSRTESAQETREMRERFETAAKLCHELNQPIQVIMGYSEILLTGLSQEHRHYKVMHLLKEQAHRMSELGKKLRSVIRKERTNGYIS